MVFSRRFLSNSAFSGIDLYIAVPINLGAVIRDAVKSGRGLPQSKTLRAAWQFPNGAERLGVLQPSGAFSPANFVSDALCANVKLNCYNTGAKATVLMRVARKNKNF